MMRSLWVAKTGLDAQQTRLDTITNNLANASTTGFKRASAQFEDMLYQTLRPAGAATAQQSQAPVGLQAGTGVRAVATARNFSQGSLQQSSGPMDLAVNGAGFFPVSMPDGTTAYTRDGQFHVDAQGQVVTAGGHPLSPPITLPANAGSITVGADGTVSAMLPGQAAAQAVGQIQLATFTAPGGLEARGQNLFVETSASGTPTLGAAGTGGSGTLSQGWLETSNVNIVEELVSMIATQRAYEINSKAIQTADAMLGRVAQL